jgi:hypothetical protein
MLVELPAAVAGGPPGQAPPWVTLQQRLMGGLNPVGQLADQLESFTLKAPFAASVLRATDRHGSCSPKASSPIMASADLLRTLTLEVSCWGANIFQAPAVILC